MLFAASIMGCVSYLFYFGFCLFVDRFIGAVARKPRFVKIYTYFIYVHFVLNIVVGIYFLVTIRESNRLQVVDECYNMLAGNSSEDSCGTLMKIPTYVFIAVVSFVLLLELCTSYARLSA